MSAHHRRALSSIVAFMVLPLFTIQTSLFASPGIFQKETLAVDTQLDDIKGSVSRLGEALTEMGQVVQEAAAAGTEPERIEAAIRANGLNDPFYQDLAGQVRVASVGDGVVTLQFAEDGFIYRVPTSDSQRIISSPSENYSIPGDGLTVSEKPRTVQTLVNFSFEELMEGARMLPKALEDAAKTHLKPYWDDGFIGTFNVRRNGASLLFHISHKQGELSPVVHKMILSAVRESISAAYEMGLITVEKMTFFISAPEVEKARMLRTTPLDVARTKRGSDPNVVALFQNVDLPMLNLKVSRILGAIEGQQSLMAIEGVPGFLVKFRHIEDIRNGRTDGFALELDSSTQREKITNLLMSQEWIAYEIQPLSYDPKQKAFPGQPMVKISVERAFSDGEFKARNVMLYFASQYGMHAVGEIAKILTDPVIGQGGQDGGEYVVLTPVTLEEAAKSPAQPGMATVTLYGFQTAEWGDNLPAGKEHLRGVSRRPKEVDYIRWTPDVYKGKTRKAQRLLDMVRRHGRHPIAITNEMARKRAEKVRAGLDQHFIAIPDPETETDPLIETVNREAPYTFTLFKADIGGELGHTVSPWLYFPVGRAKIKAAVERGLFIDGQIVYHEPEGKTRLFPFGTDFPGGAGDDIQFIAIHNHGVNSNEIHSFFMQTFLLMGAVLKWVGEDPYAWLQDIVGDRVMELISVKKPDGSMQIELGKLEAAADVKGELSQRAIQLLIEELEHGKREHALDHEQELYAEMVRLGNERAVKRVVTSGEQQAATEAKQYLDKPFSGNVQGEGPGWAELPSRTISMPFATQHTDKTGPAFFNIPVERTVVDLYQNQVPGFENGVVVQVDDTIDNKRIFLDIATQLPEYLALLADVHRYNNKRVFPKTRRDWEPGAMSGVSTLLKYVDPVYVFESSTARLSQITNGEYRGKDDAVSIQTAQVNEVFVPHAVRTATQGNARGSFKAFVRPTGLLEAVATDNSRPFQVNLVHQLTRDGRFAARQDVFAAPEYASLRQEIEEDNEFLWAAQGLFTPVGPTMEEIEPQYAAAKTFEAITGERPMVMLLASKEQVATHGENSPHKVPYAYRYHELFEEANSVEIPVGTRQGEDVNPAGDGLMAQGQESDISAQITAQLSGLEAVSLPQLVEQIVRHNGVVNLAVTQARWPYVRDQLEALYLAGLNLAGGIGLKLNVVITAAPGSQLPETITLLSGDVVHVVERRAQKIDIDLLRAGVQKLLGYEIDLLAVHPDEMDQLTENTKRSSSVITTLTGFNFESQVRRAAQDRVLPVDVIRFILGAA